MFHDMIQVFRYEMKLLSREWIFRVLAVVALVAIGVYQGVKQCEWSNFRWEMVALASSMPLVNAWLFNIVQCVLLIFIVPDLYHREQLGGELECIHTYPVNNSNYWWGKVLGIVSIFLLLQVIAILIGVFLNIFCSPAPFCFEYYWFYLLTLTLPVLLFMVGIGLCLGGLMSSRYIAQAILCVVLFLAIYWLPDRIHGTFDLLGSSLPNLFSDFTGHSDLQSYLYQRLTFVLIGIGGIMLSMLWIKRLPNSRKRIGHYAMVGGMFILAGLLNAVVWEGKHRKEEKARVVYRENFKRYWNPNTFHVAEHDIMLWQQKGQIKAESDLLIVNSRTMDLSRLVMFLNPGLEVTELTENGNSLIYTRKGQIILIERTLRVGDSLRLHIAYEGSIDESFSDLNLSDREWQNTTRGDKFFHFGRRTAFVADDYLLLTPSCAWYPAAYPPVHTEQPYVELADYSQYRLQVVNPRQKQLFSQGRRKVINDTLSFIPDCLLPGIALCGGEYEIIPWKWNGLNVKLCYLKEHDFFMKYFGRVTAKNLEEIFKERYLLEGLYNGQTFREILETWESPDEGDGKALLFIETPLVFSGEYQLARQTSSRVLPGMVLLGERGVGMDMYWDFDGSVTKMMLKNGISLEKSEALMLNSWIFNFMWGKAGNPYHILPMLSGFRVSVYSDAYPYIDYVLKVLIRDRAYNYWLFGTGENDRLTREYLIGKTLDEVLINHPMEHQMLQLRIIEYKAEELMNRLVMNEVSCKDVYNFLVAFFTDVPQNVPLEKLAEEMQEKLGIDLMKVLAEWETYRQETYFRVKECCFKRSMERGTVARIKIQNAGEAEGMISFYQKESMENENVECASVVLQPGEAKEIFVQGNYMSGRLFLWSANIPVIMECVPSHDPIDIDWEEKLVIRDLNPREFSGHQGEIIVDDQDEGFQLIESRKTFLQKFTQEKKENIGDLGLVAEKVSGWTYTIDWGAYGDRVRGYYYKTGGSGVGKAIWKANITEPGRYEVMVLRHNRQLQRFTVSEDGEYKEENQNALVNHYILYAGDWEEKIEIESEYGDQWVSLGEYDFPTGEAKLVLTDRGEPYHIIIADVAKWVRVN